MSDTVDLDELGRLEKVATPGPWRHHWTGGMRDAYVVLAEVGEVAAVRDTAPRAEANLHFIAATRNALPALIAELREVRAELATYRDPGGCVVEPGEIAEARERGDKAAAAIAERAVALEAEVVELRKARDEAAKELDEVYWQDGDVGESGAVDAAAWLDRRRPGWRGEE